MQFTDALELGKPRRTKDGYLAVRARSARTGVYKYSGREVDPDNQHGLRDLATVNVLRDDETVFDEGAARSFIGKPVTVDHPSEPVTSANWKDHARGAIMGALRDGDYLAFDLLLMDASAIADVEAGKRELSNGYGAELQFGDFAAADGTKCRVRQSRITDGNHVAIVKAGRAGPDCRISDGGNARFETCDAAPVILNLTDAVEEKHVKTITLDGLKVDLSDAEAVQAAITKLQTAATDATTKLTDAEKQVAALTTDKATLEAKATTLEKQVEDAKVTPAKLRDAAKAYQAVVDKAKALGVEVTDEMDEAAIQKAVVDKHVGDAAKDWTPELIAVSFATISVDAKGEPHQPLRIPVTANDQKGVQDAYAEMVSDMQKASQPTPAKAA